jgi:undecaprenyl-diphosphatase
VSNADLSVFNLMREMRNAPADELMVTITLLGDFVVLLAMMTAAVLWLIWRKAYRAAFAALVTFLAGRLSIAVLKSVMQRPRPVDFDGMIESFAFPSGHATMTALAFGVVAVLVSHSMGRWGRAVVYATCGIAVVAVAFSRLYLGVHWMSDVIGGLLFGAVMAAAFAVAIEAIPPRRIRPLGLFGATLIAFIGAGALHVGWNYATAEEIYAPHSRTVRVDEARWQAEDWKQLPAKRIDLAGKREEVFLAQWVGDIGLLGGVLAASGWSERPRWTWSDILPYLNPGADLTDLAPRPALHEGLKAISTYVKPLPNMPTQRQVLRVFRTSTVVVSKAGNGESLLYLLSLTRERLRRGFHLYAVPSALASTEVESEALLGVLAADPRLHIVAQNPVDGTSQALVLASP